MKNLKNLTLLAISSLIVFTSAPICSAADIEWNEVDRETILSMAKEQDRFILLFAGNYKDRCRYCLAAYDKLNNPSGPLRSIVDDNYVPWFQSLFVYGSTAPNPNMSDFEMFISGYLAIRTDPNVSKQFPIICVINPDDPYEDHTEFWGPAGERTTAELLNAITLPGIFAGQQLKWHEDKEEAFALAKAQEKFIFKMVGKDSSPNSKKVVKQLSEEPLKQMMEDNFILWYSYDVSEIPEVVTYAETTLPFPYISIIDPEEPDENLISSFGYQDVETLEEMVKPYTVSNEIVASVNNVVVMGHVLQISNQTLNEQIQIFNLNGQRIANVFKKDYSVQIDASFFPKGVLVVCSSSGWSTKIIVQ